MNQNPTPKPKPPVKRPAPVKAYEPPKWYPLRGHKGLAKLRLNMEYGKKAEEPKVCNCPRTGGILNGHDSACPSHNS